MNSVTRGGKGSYQKLIGAFKSFFTSRPKKVIYPIQIPLSGVKDSDIKYVDGDLIIDSDYLVRVIEAGKSRSGAFVTSYGFQRDIVLPQNIRIDDVQYRIDDHHVYLGWEKEY